MRVLISAMIFAVVPSIVQADCGRRIYDPECDRALSEALAEWDREGDRAQDRRREMQRERDALANAEHRASRARRDADLDAFVAGVDASYQRAEAAAQRHQPRTFNVYDPQSGRTLYGTVFD